MELNTYCDNMASELNSWKARIDDIVERFDKTSCADKSRAFPHFNQLRMMTEELNDRIFRIRTECSVQWEPEKMEIERRFGHLSRTWEDVWEDVSPAEIGG